MASTADNHVALQVMKEANEDFLVFISKIKAFFNSEDPVEFDFPGSSEPIIVNSIMKLISDYRLGKFEELILGSQSSGVQIKLSVDGGRLKVTDLQGNLAYVDCGHLSASVIEKSTAKKVTAEACEVKSIEGRTSVTGGSVSLSSISVNDLTADYVQAENCNVRNLKVEDTLSCSQLTTLGTRRLAFNSVRKVFSRNNAPLNNAASLLTIAADGEWDMVDSAADLTPLDLGFGYMQGGATADLIEICGTTKYQDFVASRRAWVIAGSTFHFPMTMPKNVRAYINDPFNGITARMFDIEGDPQLAALMAWPSGFFFPQIGVYGTLYLAAPMRTEEGKEIYYKVMENPWSIYRYMRLIYKNNQPDHVEFGGLMQLPAYSCYRFAISLHDTRYDYGAASDRELIYTLEPV